MPKVEELISGARVRVVAVGIVKAVHAGGVVSLAPNADSYSWERVTVTEVLEALPPVVGKGRRIAHPRHAGGVPGEVLSYDGETREYAVKLEGGGFAIIPDDVRVVIDPPIVRQLPEVSDARREIERNEQAAADVTNPVTHPFDSVSNGCTLAGGETDADGARIVHREAPKADAIESDHVQF